MTDEMKMVGDLIQHAVTRIGKVLEDTTDLMPHETGVLQMYALVYAHAFAALNHGLEETQPLYAKCDLTQRCGILSTLVGHTLDPKAKMPGLEALTLQYVSDSKAATAEVAPYFNFQIVWK